MSFIRGALGVFMSMKCLKPPCKETDLTAMSKNKWLLFSIGSPFSGNV